MLYTFVETDITEAALYNLNIINAKIFTTYNNQCHGEESFLSSQQLLSCSLNSLTFT